MAYIILYKHLWTHKSFFGLCQRYLLLIISYCKGLEWRHQYFQMTYFFIYVPNQIRSDQISRSVMSNSLQPHESWHTRPPCPSPTPGVHWDSHPSSQWCPPIHNWVLFYFASISSFFLALFLHWSPVAYWAPTDLRSSSFSVLSFCLFIIFMRFSRREYWSGLPFLCPDVYMCVMYIAAGLQTYFE